MNRYIKQEVWIGKQGHAIVIVEYDTETGIWQSFGGYHVRAGLGGTDLAYNYAGYNRTKVLRRLKAQALRLGPL